MSSFDFCFFGVACIFHSLWIRNGHAEKKNWNEINKSKGDGPSRPYKIWTVLIDEINYSTRKTTAKKSVKNWKHRYWFICGMPFKLADVYALNNTTLFASLLGFLRITVRFSSIFASLSSSGTVFSSLQCFSCDFI